MNTFLALLPTSLKTNVENAKKGTPAELVESVVSVMGEINKNIDKMDRNDHRAWQGDENPQTNGEGERMQNGLADGIRQMLNAKNESGETFSSISVQIAEQKMFQVLVRQMWMVDFETKKGVAELFWQCLKAPCPGGFTFAYVMEHYDDIVVALSQGYRKIEFSAHITGHMLRECFKNSDIVVRTLRCEEVMSELFAAADLRQFDMATDAWLSMTVLLTAHKKAVADYLTSEYATFFQKYNSLLQSDNYATQRQSLKLLMELLLDRTNFSVMTKYISETSNLKIVMQLLKNKSTAIQFDAFQIFKLFVGNPTKPRAVCDILRANGEKIKLHLMKKLTFSHEEFQEDKQDVLDEITKLQREPIAPVAAAEAAPPSVIVSDK